MNLVNCTLALLTASGIHYEMKVLRWSGGRGGGLPIKSLFNKTGRGLNEAVRAAGRASLGEAAQGLVGSHMAVENPR